MDGALQLYIKEEFCSFKVIKLWTLKSNLFCLSGRWDDLRVFHFQVLVHLGLVVYGIFALVFGFFCRFFWSFFFSLYFSRLTLFRSFLLLDRDGVEHV